MLYSTVNLINHSISARDDYSFCEQEKIHANVKKKAKMLLLLNNNYHFLYFPGAVMKFSDLALQCF